MLRGVLYYGLVVFAVPCMAQPSIDWERNLGGSSIDIPWGLDRTADGGVVVVGETESTNGDVLGSHGTVDVWVVKLDANGEVEWQRCSGGSAEDKGQHIRQTVDDGYIMCGFTTSVDGDVSVLNGPMDIWVVKLNSAGDMEWQRSYGGTSVERGWALEELPNGGYYLLAETSSIDSPMEDSHGPRDFWLARIAGNGDLLWSRSYGGSSDEIAHDMAVLEDGSVIMVGLTRSADGDVSGIHGQSPNFQPDVWVLKVNNAGEQVWQLCMGGGTYDLGWGVTVAPNGKIYVASTTNSTDGDVSDAHGDWDYWITRLSADGELELERSFGGSNSDQVQAITSTVNNEIIVTGSSPSTDGDITAPRGGSDAWSIKLDLDLEIIWERSFGGTLSETGRDILWSDDGVITFVASCASSDGDVSGNHGFSDFWVVKLQPENVGIPEPSTTGGLTVFPDPANDHIRITWPDLDVISLEVYDACGRRVSSESGALRGLRQFDMDVSDWSDGLYTVSVHHRDGFLSRRFVKH